VLAQGCDPLEPPLAWRPARLRRVGRGPAGSGRMRPSLPGRPVMPWRGRDPLGYPGCVPSLPLSPLP